MSIFTNKMADTEQPKVVLSPDSAGDDKDKITFMQPKIAQINQRTLTSNCHSSLNRYRFRIIYGFLLKQKNLAMKYEKSFVKSQCALLPFDNFSKQMVENVHICHFLKLVITFFMAQECLLSNYCLKSVF